MLAVMSLQIEFDSTGASFAAYKTRYPVSGTPQYPLANGKVTANTFGWSSFEFGGVHVFLITPCVHPTCQSFRSLPFCLVLAITNAGTVAANMSMSSVAATAVCSSARFQCIGICLSARPYFGANCAVTWTTVSAPTSTTGGCPHWQRHVSIFCLIVITALHNSWTLGTRARTKCWALQKTAFVSSSTQAAAVDICLKATTRQSNSDNVGDDSPEQQ